MNEMQEAKEDMLPDGQIQGKNPTEEEHMPFSQSVLTKSLIDYASKYLNETQEVREESLQAVREYLKNDLGIHHKENEEYLLFYLRSRNFDIKQTCFLLKESLKFLKSHRQYIDRIDVQTIRQVVESNNLGFLPYRDSESRPIFLLRSGNWDPCIIKPEDIIFGSIVALHMAVENPINQVTGLVVILDYRNLKMKHIVAMSSWINLGIQALKQGCTYIAKEYHVIHTPSLFIRSAWKIAKPLLSENIRNRITFHESATWESLHRRIPPAILPEELGGHLGPFSNSHWASDMTFLKKHFDDSILTILDEMSADSQ